MRQTLDYRAKRFGALVALFPCHRTLSTGRKMTAWYMRCDCGRGLIAFTENIRKGKHHSCGCRYHMWPDGKKPVADPALKVDRRKLPKPRLGKARWPEYRIYRQMLDRCYLKSARNYHWYGARGITVCDRWRYGENGQTGFECFIADVGRRPEGLTIDRIDVNGNYEPGNVRWATWEMQARNKRRKAA